MEKEDRNTRPKRFAILINLLIITAIAITGIFIAYMFMALFTKHGAQTTVPKVENMSYTKAVELLHSKGFNVDIRDSLFLDNVKPGWVLEQFPRANSVVKPGRKIFLYINAVHPKEIVMDDGADRTALAFRDWSHRQVKARLTELGFKNISTVSVLGADDRVVKVLANGKPVFKMQKVPINASIVVEISDGRLNALRDSLYEAERLRDYIPEEFGEYPGGSSYTPSSSTSSPNRSAGTYREMEEEPEYFEIPDEFYDEPEVITSTNEEGE